MTKLRLAEEADIPTIVEFGAAFHAESSFQPMTFAPEKVAINVRHGIESGLVVLAEVDGRIVGGMHGDVVEPWYSSDRMGVEYFLYVLPEFRGSWAAVLMLKAWIRWCAASGATQIRPGTAAHIGVKADRLYAGLGFRPAGSLYVMNREQFGD